MFLLVVFVLLFVNIGYIHCTVDYHDSNISLNCSMRAADDSVREQISLSLEKGKKIIFLKLQFQDKLPKALDEYTGSMYRLLEWVRTVGRHGRSMLYLRPQFVFLSLSTLSFETDSITVTIRDSPNGCLSGANATMIEEKLKALLLADFRPEPEGGSLSEHEYICNMHIKNDNSRAKFFYQCCHKDVSGDIVCEDLLYDFWINIVFLCVTIINVIAVMFSPYLIPASMYRQKYGRNVYEYVLSSPLILNIKRTDGRTALTNNPNLVSMSYLKATMPNFHSQIKDLPMHSKKTFVAKKVELNVKYRKVIPANYVPIGILKTFFSMFVECNIRKSSKFEQCCKSSIFGKCCMQKSVKYSSDKKDENVKTKANHPWYKCLRTLMKLVMLVLVTTPWVARIVFFYKFEESHIKAQRNASTIRNLSLPFQWNLTNTLTPIHTVFLICYGIFVLDGLVFGVLSHNVKEKLQFLMRKCLRDMREMSRSKALRWSILVLMLPFEICGIFGFVCFGIYFVFAIPFVLAVIAFYCLPTVNVVVRLFIHFLAYLMPYGGGACVRRSSCLHSKSVHKLFYLDVLSSDETVDRPETVSIKNRVLQLVVLVACLFTVFSFVLLAMEIILFLTDIFIYTIIGIVMNASAVLKYISLIFMLVLYGRDCFNGISDKYLAFNKLMNRLVVDQLRDKVEQVASLTPGEQRNTAFQLEIDSGTTEKVDNASSMATNFELLVKSGTIKCKVPRLILFLDKNDKPYLSEKFFLECCYMNTVGVPGPLVYNLVRATWRFLCICVFLVFVVFIVLAFGDEYQISGTNQMLATLAGGFLPWVFRNVLFKSKDKLELDTKNLSFKSNLDHIIRHFNQCFGVADIGALTIDKNELRDGVAATESTHSDKEYVEEDNLFQGGEDIKMLSCSGNPMETFDGQIPEVGFQDSGLLQNSTINLIVYGT